MISRLLTAAVLTQANASYVHVIGMSFGGGLSAYWAATTLIPVKSVVMLAPVVDYEDDVLGQHGAIVGGKLREKEAQEAPTAGVCGDGTGFGMVRAMLNELRFISGD